MNPAECLRAGLVTGRRRDDLLARYGSQPVTISVSPVVAIGGGASDKAAAEAKGPGMDLSNYAFDALYEDATLVLCRGRDRARSGPRLCLTRLDGRGHGCILASIGSRVVLASRRAIGT